MYLYSVRARCRGRVGVRVGIRVRVGVGVRVRVGVRVGVGVRVSVRVGVRVRVRVYQLAIEECESELRHRSQCRVDRHVLWLGLGMRVGGEGG